MAVTLLRARVAAHLPAMLPGAAGPSLPRAYATAPDERKHYEIEVTPPPDTMPYFDLPNGRMPGIGTGTFTGTRLTQTETIKKWLRVGGRGIDAAQNYLNEAEIGDALTESIAEGIVTRDEVFISSKLNNPYHRREHVQPALEKTLKDLNVDSVDMYLMHWPTAFKYVPFSPNERGFPQEYEPDQCSKVTGVLWQDYRGPWPPPHLDHGVTIHETWNAMVECWKKGLAKNIGVCNFKVTLLHELLCGTDVYPHLVQCESHPYFQQWKLIDFCDKLGVQFQGYSPLGYGAFARPDEITVLRNPVLQAIGDRHGKSTAQVCLQWAVQRGAPTCPFSLKESEMRQNLVAGSWSLTDADMEEIRGLDRGHHYLRPDDWYGLPLWD